MIKTFYPNEPDDLHCLQSSVRMVFEHLTHSPLNLRAAEQFTGFVEGLQTWPFETILSFANSGFEVINIEKMDNERFAKDPKGACIEEFGEHLWDHFCKVSDIKKAQEAALKCVKHSKIRMEQRIPTIDDLEKLLSSGFLAICNVNAKALTGKNGYNGHFVLVEKVDLAKSSILIQNPGLPAIQDQVVSFEKFTSAWYSPDEKAGNIMAIRLVENVTE